MRALLAVRDPGFFSVKRELELAFARWRQLDERDGFFRCYRLDHTVGLVARGAGTGDPLDAHPLVREYFGARLKERSPEAWTEGHRGYLYCDLLLEQGAATDVLHRARQTLAWAAENGSRLAVALDHLSLGRAHLALGDVTRARQHFD